MAKQKKTKSNIRQIVSNKTIKPANAAKIKQFPFTFPVYLICAVVLVGGGYSLPMRSGGAMNLKSVQSLQQILR